MDSSCSFASPLLTQDSDSHQHDFQTHEEEEEEEKLSVEEIIETYVSGLSPAQLFQIVIVSLGWLFDSQHTFVTIFTDAQPSWRCTNSSNYHHNLQFSDIKNCGAESSICSMDPRLWEWERGKETSVISEWNLVCANSLKAALPASFFFLGWLIGGSTVATLADSWLGRKRMLMMSCFMISVFGFLTALSPNIWMYALLRGISGFGRAPLSNCCLVLSTEVVGRKWRGHVGFLGYFFFTVGFISLPGIAYVSRFSSWRKTYIWISILPMAYSMFLLPFFCESPRWLATRGRVDEALLTLRRMSKFMNRKGELPQNVRVISSATEEKQHGSALWSLWNSIWARKRMAMSMAVGFGTGLIYYGMPLGAGNLDFNLYISVTLNAVAEIPAAIVSSVLIAKAERRIPLLVLTLASGVLCIVCVFFSLRNPYVKRNWGQIMGELGAFWSACTAFDVLLIYCVELFPTSVRSSGISMVRQAIAVGAAFSPLLVAVGRTRGVWLSFLVFGVVIMICGIFVLGLPETRNRPLYETLEDIEQSQEEAASLFDSNDRDAASGCA